MSKNKRRKKALSFHLAKDLMKNSNTGKIPYVFRDMFDLVFYGIKAFDFLTRNKKEIKKNDDLISIFLEKHAHVVRIMSTFRYQKDYQEYRAIRKYLNKAHHECKNVSQFLEILTAIESSVIIKE